MERFPRTAVVVLLGLAVLAAQVHADEPIDKNGNLRLPRFLGSPRSVNVNKSLGSLTESIPIVVPPGSHGMEPKIRLEYSSAGGYGPAGFGWNLNTGSIQISRPFGYPTADNNASVTYNVSMPDFSGEIIDTGGGLFRAKYETVYREFRRVDNGWMMQDGLGNQYRFGSTDASRIPNQLWMLDQLTDASGIPVRYEYVTSGTNLSLRLDKITYSGPGPQLGYRVLFSYCDATSTENCSETAPQTPRYSWRNGVAEKLLTDSRLTRISVVNFIVPTAVGVPDYTFDYTFDPTNGQSLLSAIKYGDIPIRKFEYQTRALGWPGGLQNTDSNGQSARYQWSVDGYDSFDSLKDRVMDINGDGIADVVKPDPMIANAGECFRPCTGVYIGAGALAIGYYKTSTNWNRDWGFTNALTALNIALLDDTGNDNGVRFVDLNGDRLPDIVVAWDKYDSHQYPHWINSNRVGAYLNTGHGWTFNADYTNSLASIIGSHSFIFTEPTHPDTTVPPAFLQKNVQFVDVNGDGRADMVWSIAGDGHVFFNTGSGWSENSALSNAIRNYELKEGVDLIDVNGDGLADIMNSNSLSVAINTGSSFVQQPVPGVYRTFPTEMASIDAYKRWRGVIPGDFNDDGLVDFIVMNPTMRKAFLNTGSGWIDWPQLTSVLNSFPASVTFAAYDGYPQRIDGKLVDMLGAGTATLADVDGNGVMDIFTTAGPCPAPIQPYCLANGATDDGAYTASGLRSGFLSKVTTGLGEVTTITWRTAPGAPAPVVSQISRSDGRTAAAATTYSYSGPGSYAGGQFHGFRTVSETESNGRQITSTLFQRDGLIGALERQVQTDPASGVSLTLTNEYTCFPNIFLDNCSPNGVQQIRLAGVTETKSSGIETSVNYTHDSYLNVVIMTKDPDTSVANDELATRTTYAAPAATWSPGVPSFWSLPTSFTIENTAGDTLSKRNLTYESDNTNRLKETSEPATLNSDPLIRKMSYDGSGNVTQIIDRAGGTSHFVYDFSGTFRTKATDAAGRTVLSTYDPLFGNLLTDTDASGNVKSYQYDSYGRLTKVTLPGDEHSTFGTRSYVYSLYGNASTQSVSVRSTETPGTGDTLDATMYFDGMGQVYREQREGPTANSPIEMRKTFDFEGNVTSVSRPYFPATESPVFTTFTHDTFGRTTTIREPDGISTKMVYGARGRTDVNDRRGVTTTTYVNSDGKPVRIEQPLNGRTLVTKYEYDPFTLKVSAIVNPLGARTEATFDMLGRQLTFKDPSSGTVSYEYDGENRLTKVTQPGNVVTTLTRNAAGDLLQKQTPTGTSVYTYNAAGRLVSIQDAGGTVAMKYDGVGNVIERRRTVSVPGTVFPVTYVTGYAFDSLGRLRQVAYPDGFQAIYQYDPSGEPSAVVDNTGAVIASGLQHNAAGRMMSMTFGNGVGSVFTYDDMLRMSSSFTQSPTGGYVHDFEYKYDAGGNVLAITSPFAFDASQSFQYDSLSRITRGSGPYGDETYAYDDIGNLIRNGDYFLKPDPAHPEQIMCGVQIRLRPGQAAPANPCTTSSQSFHLYYDERGNIVQRPGYQYTYDADNHLLTVKDGSGNLIEENIYDSEGRRLVQHTYRPSNEVRVFIDGIFEITGDQAVRHVNLQAMRLASIVTPVSSVHLITDAPPAPWAAGLTPTEELLGLFAILALALGTVYAVRRLPLPLLKPVLSPRTAGIVLLLVPAMLCVDVPSTFAQSEGAPPQEDRYYYHPNHLGSITAITDQSGNIVSRRDYKPYGMPFVWTGGVDRNLAKSFGSHSLDDATGMYNFGGRYYDPTIGRFLTPDNTLPDPGNPQALHRYALGADNPVRYSDPTGHSIWDIIVAAIVVVVIVVVIAVTFGAAAGILVAAFAIAGAIAFGLWARSKGLSGEALARSIVTGALLGALVGAAIVTGPYTFAEGGGPLEEFVSTMLFNIALGGGQDAAAGLGSGSGPDDILGGVLESMGVAAVNAAATGAKEKAGFKLPGAAGTMKAGLDLGLTFEGIGFAAAGSDDPLSGRPQDPSAFDLITGGGGSSRSGYTPVTAPSYGSFHLCESFSCR